MGYLDIDVQCLVLEHKRRERLRLIENLNTILKTDTVPTSGLETKSLTSESAEIPMDLDLYEAAKQGDSGDFFNKLEKVANAKGLRLAAVFYQVSPIGNTYLHVAASFGNKEITSLIATSCRPLINKKNVDGDTALHLAVRAGQFSSTLTLLDSWKDNVGLPSDEEGDESKKERDNLLTRLTNGKGNTPLHEALLNYHEGIASMLIATDPEVAFYPNKSLESPLYLAAKAGYKDCVSKILSFKGELSKMIDGIKAAKSPIHAAIRNRNKDALELMSQAAPNLIHFTDEEGRLPLHYAASLGYLEEVCYILGKDPPCAFEKDNNGLLSIHWASIKGHILIIKELLLHFPVSTELLDANGHSILHFAARSGKDKVVSYILKDRSFEVLINLKDKQGNTPLHLAAMHYHPKIVSALTWDSRVNLTVENNLGMTALDAAEDCMDKPAPFQQVWT